MNQLFLKQCQRWIQSVNDNDLDDVVGLYDRRPTFHPTLSGEFIQDDQGVRDYFTKFLAMNPRVNIVKFAIQELLDTAFLYVGIMEIRVDENGVRTTKYARFTFVWVSNGEHWNIIHHHNSLVPKLD
ncbi:MAG: nuclear transport factor 2 family protein [Gammaproteobacteria bacterium]|nr:nuclear transport factor 2 family protein [Gammaproteobacteria bacterium]